MGIQSDTGTVIAVFGGHAAGIGRTTLAINLAAALARETGSGVALADLDTRFGDIAILMDFPVERSLVDIVAQDEISRDTLRSCLYTQETGMAVLPAPIRPDDWRAVDARSVRKAVKLLAQDYDYVVLDNAATYNDTVVCALEMADVVLMVTTTDDRCLENTRAAIDHLRSWGRPEDWMKLVVTAICLDRDAYMGVKGPADIRIGDVAKTLDKQVDWVIPYDRRLHREIVDVMPIVSTYPNSPAAKSVAGLAHTLTER